MTINDLKNYKYLKKQKALLESEKAELILKSNPPDNSKGKTNKTSDTVAQTVENREELQADIDKIKNQMQVIEQYIAGCDKYIGKMLRMHYIDGLSWTAVAMRQGGDNTKDSVRMVCHRYIKENP